MQRYSVVAQKPDIFRCICSNRDRLSFCADIQIIFGTVYEYIVNVLTLHTVYKIRLTVKVSRPMFRIRMDLYLRMHPGSGSAFSTDPGGKKVEVNPVHEVN